MIDEWTNCSFKKPFIHHCANSSWHLLESDELGKIAFRCKFHDDDATNDEDNHDHEGWRWYFFEPPSTIAIIISYARLHIFWPKTFGLIRTFQPSHPVSDSFQATKCCMMWCRLYNVDWINASKVQQWKINSFVSKLFTVVRFFTITSVHCTRVSGALLKRSSDCHDDELGFGLFFIIITIIIIIFTTVIIVTINGFQPLSRSWWSWWSWWSMTWWWQVCSLVGQLHPRKTGTGINTKLARDRQLLPFGTHCTVLCSTL